MSARKAMTITTLGLSLRDETLIRSLLNVVSGTTRAEWAFIDEMDADLALCDPQSPMTRVAIQKYKRSGRPLCVAVRYENQQPSELPDTIRAPLRVREFIDLLDRTADPTFDATASSPAAAGDAGSGERRHLATVLGRLIAAGDGAQQSGIWRLSLGGHALYVALPDRRYATSEGGLSLDSLLNLAQSNEVDSAMSREDHDPQARAAIDAGRPLGPLLWRIGLQMPIDPTAPWLKPDALLRLKRWPDFGHLGSHKSHLSLAALLTKRSWRMQALAEASGQSRDTLQSFLAASALCGLLEIEHDAPVSSAADSSGARPRFGVSGLFRSLRNALRMGD